GLRAVRASPRPRVEPRSLAHRPARVPGNGVGAPRGRVLRRVGPAGGGDRPDARRAPRPRRAPSSPELTSAAAPAAGGVEHRFLSGEEARALGVAPPQGWSVLHEPGGGIVRADRALAA